MTVPVMYPSESARAASREESRFRITRPLAPARNARVIALDRAAEAVARRVARGPWARARFYTVAGGAPARGGTPVADGRSVVGGTPVADGRSVVGGAPVADGFASGPGGAPVADGFASGPGGAPAESVPLFELHGRPVALTDVLTGTDVVVILATEDSGRAKAAAIGRECGARSITTAGVILGDGFEADDAMAALRPYARVLLLSADESDVFELLTALRV
jgi:hypothetical protein